MRETGESSKMAGTDDRPIEDRRAYLEQLRTENRLKPREASGVEEGENAQNKFQVEVKRASELLKYFNDYQQTDPNKLDVLRTAAGMPEGMFEQSMENSTLISTLDLSGLGRSDIEGYTRTLKTANDNLQVLKDEISSEFLEPESEDRPRDWQREFETELKKAAKYRKKFAAYEKDCPGMLREVRESAGITDEFFNKILNRIAISLRISEKIKNNTYKPSASGLENAVNALNTANEFLEALEDRMQNPDKQIKPQDEFQSEVQEASTHLRNFLGYKETDPDILGTAQKSIGMSEETFNETLYGMQIISTLDTSNLSDSDIEEYTRNLRTANESIKKLENAIQHQFSRKQKIEARKALRSEEAVASLHLTNFISYESTNSTILETARNAIGMSEDTFNETIADIKRIANADPSSQTESDVEESIETLRTANERLQKLEEAVQDEFLKPENRSAGKQKS